MEYKDFIKEVERHIKDYLPEEWKNEEVSVRQQLKNNGIQLYGMSIRIPGSDLTPQIYLDNAYQSYNMGVSMEEILKKLAEQYLKSVETAPKLGIHKFDYENWKDSLFMCAINADKNRKLLSSVPHQIVEDLAVVYRYLIEEDGGIFGTVLVNNDHLKLWNIDSEMLHEQAEKSMKQLMPYEFHSMDYVIADIMGSPIEESQLSMENSFMFVLSNSKKWQGASYLFCPDVLEAVSKELGGNYLILPSSIHELVLIREEKERGIEDLKDIVCDINQSQVVEEERLSNELYRYDAEAGSISMVSDGEMQQGMHLEM